MNTPTELIQLSLKDDPEHFYKKLLHIPQDKLYDHVKRFEKYAWYWSVLKFHREALRRPRLNIRITYNNLHGWHISSCMKSVLQEDVSENVCTCQEDIRKPKLFFHRILKEVVLNPKYKFNCTVCKSEIPLLYG